MTATQVPELISLELLQEIAYRVQFVAEMETPVEYLYPGGEYEEGEQTKDCCEFIENR